MQNSGILVDKTLNGHNPLSTISIKTENNATSSLSRSLFSQLLNNEHDELLNNTTCLTTNYRVRSAFFGNNQPKQNPLEVLLEQKHFSKSVYKHLPLKIRR